MVITLYKKPIWKVKIKRQHGYPDQQTFERQIAAYDLKELLSYFKEDAIKDVTYIEKTTDKIEYFTE